MELPPSGTFYPQNNVFVDGYGQRLGRVHSVDLCADRDFCVIHNQSVHHMSTWKLLWRSDRRIFERICPHGIGHPDPDDMAYHHSIGNSFEGVHGCDGCCRSDDLPFKYGDPDEWPIHDNDCPAKSEGGYGPCTCTEVGFEFSEPPSGQEDDCICVYPDKCFCSHDAKVRRAVLDMLGEDKVGSPHPQPPEDTPPDLLLGLYKKAYDGAMDRIDYLEDTLLLAEQDATMSMVHSLQDDLLDRDEEIRNLKEYIAGLEQSYDSVVVSRNFWRDLANRALDGK